MAIGFILGIFLGLPIFWIVIGCRRVICWYDEELEEAHNENTGRTTIKATQSPKHPDDEKELADTIMKNMKRKI